MRRLVPVNFDVTDSDAASCENNVVTTRRITVGSGFSVDTKLETMEAPPETVA